MPELTQLRLPGEAEFSWYALDRAVDRPLGCHNCNRRIDQGEPHARGDDGRRLCAPCIETCWVGRRMATAEANRRRRELRIEHAMEAGARMLLDGLDVETIGELRRLVLLAREVEDGVDRFTGARYEQMNPMTGPISCVYVALRPGTSAGEVDAVVEEEASAWARHAVARMRCLLEGAPDGS